MLALPAGIALGMIALSVSGHPSPRLPEAPSASLALDQQNRNRRPSLPLLPPPTLVLKADDTMTSARLNRLFSRLGYDLELVAAGYMSVPRVVLETLPDDLDSIESPDRRKSLFVRALLPAILQVNEEIGTNRAALMSMQERMDAGDTLHDDDIRLMTGLAASLELSIQELTPAALLRVYDIIPPSLALAQAIEESGWGTSRIAQDQNALFGQFGPVVHGRRNYREYASLMDGIRSYAHNLNSHPAYARFRGLRASLRQKTEPGLSGTVLAGTLEDYCTNGTAYVQTLRTIIRANGLAALDHVHLSTQGFSSALALK